MTTKISKMEKNMRDEYNAFIKQLDIENIRVTNAKIENIDCSYFPSNAEIKWRISARYENTDGKCDVYHTFNVTISDKETKIKKAKISLTLCVRYLTDILMTDSIFEIFRERNLPLNTWPYYREFVQDALSRMGWPPYSVPVFKP